MKVYKTDVCVVGGGSGGIGAALSAASNGADVILIEKNQILGGTVTMAWVHTWEPVCGTSPLCEKLWNRMCEIPLGATPKNYSDSATYYDKVTGRHGSATPFEPWAYVTAVEEEIAAAGNIKVICGSSFVASEDSGNIIKRIFCHNIVGDFIVEAKYFIDCSADIYLARESGCAYSVGADARAEYDEPHAPEVADTEKLNGINWVYRVRPCGHPVSVDDSPMPGPRQLKSLFLVTMPNGDILVNICGHGRLKLNSHEEYASDLLEQKQFAWDTYRWQILGGAHPDWEFLGFAPQIGIRETYRLKARYVVTENDVLAGLSGQSRKDFIATCDHSVDIHGAAGSYELKQPFGIPMEALMAREYDNLLVACRGAGFSHIAAASCRLSRTMMTLGEAAGRFAALCIA